MDIDSKEAKKAIERGTLFSFIPRRLEVKDRPELNNFSLNVLFASFAVKNGNRVMGNALYYPDLPSFKHEGDALSMKYRNAYGGVGRPKITFKESRKSYIGEKFINGKPVGAALGTNWQVFFIHFTALGLANGERCKFENTD